MPGILKPEPQSEALNAKLHALLNVNSKSYTQNPKDP